MDKVCKFAVFVCNVCCKCGRGSRGYCRPAEEEKEAYEIDEKHNSNYRGPAARN